MHWKETDLTVPAEAQGRYQITIAALEAIRLTGATVLAEPIKAQHLELLPIGAPVAQPQDLQVELIEALAQLGLQAEPTEVAQVVPPLDHRAATIEAPVAPTVPVEA
jgi:hypothetical protein|tara:strand:+ start:458 stop:778 length:321 start_codon:yes stop_codon:yes gene_type:complete